MWACLLAVLAMGAVGAARPPVPQPSDASRIVAIGDIHGSADGLVQILRAAALIDDKERWTGGNARLVQTGDFTDRGDQVRRVMDLLMRLEGDARRAGGRVDVLFGNHEGMNVLRDLRDVSAGAYATFADQRSEDRRRRAYETHADIAKRAGNTPPDRDTWMASRPAGFVEYVEAFEADGRYGRWIRARKPVLQIGETIFMHAGLTPDAPPASVEEVNRAVERDVRMWDGLVGMMERAKLISSSFVLSEIIDVAQVEIGKVVAATKSGEALGEHVTAEYVNALKHLQGIPKWSLIDADGPLWYRGFATLNEDARPQIDALLAKLGARRFVTGHTPQLPGGRISVRFGGRNVLIDTGLLTSYFKGGQPSALEIQGGRLTAIYTKGREPIGTVP